MSDFSRPRGRPRGRRGAGAAVEDAVIAMVKESAGHYALSTDYLFALKKRGV